MFEEELGGANFNRGCAASLTKILFCSSRLGVAFGPGIVPAGLGSRLQSPHRQETWKR